MRLIGFILSTASPLRCDVLTVRLHHNGNTAVIDRLAFKENGRLQQAVCIEMKDYEKR